MIVLDTNVISEIVRSRPDERVVAWRPGDGGFAIAPTPVPLTRGLGGGRFLSVTDGSVEVVTVTVRPRI